MRAFPTPDPRDGEVLAARPVPRAQWRTYPQWGRCSRHCCQTYRHPPAASKSLPLVLGTLASTRQTAAQRAQAHGAVASDAVCVLPEGPAWPDDAAGAPTRPQASEEGRAARTQASGRGQSRLREDHAQALSGHWRDSLAERGLGSGGRDVARRDTAAPVFAQDASSVGGRAAEVPGVPGQDPSGGVVGRGGQAVFGRSGGQATRLRRGATPGVERLAVSAPTGAHQGTR
jgi:hypothetical protein